MTKIILIAFISLSLSGCGSFSNLVKMMMPQRCDDSNGYIYGGVLTDCTMISKGFSSTNPAKIGFGVIDMPFSFLADTLMLPISIKEDIRRQNVCEPD